MSAGLATTLIIQEIGPLPSVRVYFKEIHRSNASKSYIRNDWDWKDVVVIYKTLIAVNPHGNSICTSTRNYRPVLATFLTWVHYCSHRIYMYIGLRLRNSENSRCFSSDGFNALHVTAFVFSFSHSDLGWQHQLCHSAGSMSRLSKYQRLRYHEIHTDGVASIWDNQSCTNVHPISGNDGMTGWKAQGRYVAN